MDQHLGALLFVGFDGTSLSVETRAFLSDLRPGGVILFKRNLVDPHQTRRLTDDLRETCDPEPMIAVDEEGGMVSRLREFAPTLPPGARLAATRDPALVRSLAASLGRIVASLGFDIDFAPVLDLCAPAATNGIGNRSFGTDPLVAAVMGEAYLQGLADSGIAGCLKHFPGLGPTTSDSHLELPTVTKGEADFLREDLVPFRRLRDHAPIAMIAHGHYPFFCGAEPLAATLVPAVATDLLRRDVGFDGVALADDLEMKAVAARVGWDELAPRAILAGCDMLLVCKHREAIEKSHQALSAWLAAGRLPEPRIAEAQRRVAQLRERIAALRARRSSPSGTLFADASADLSSRLEGIA